MQLYFIRHGQSTNNALLDDNEDQGSPSRSEDPDLTLNGVKQAQLTAEALAHSNPQHQICHSPYGDTDFQNRRGFDLTHLYCGLMIRAVHTGSIIAERLSLPLMACKDMHECGGIYLDKEIDGKKTVEILHGKGKTWFAKHYPSLQFHQPIAEAGWWPGGKEAPALQMERAFRVIQFLKDRHMGTNDRVGLITHGSFFILLFRALFKLDLQILRGADTPYHLVYNNCAITRFDFDETRIFKLIYLNRTCHLPDELIT
ncbi:MAG: histidine phosphatase family protein [Anaerolineaceae bacterium]|nr:histidine phosphatase family protein [Anaerolineaceae bacterium]